MHMAYLMAYKFTSNGFYCSLSPAGILNEKCNIFRYFNEKRNSALGDIYMKTKAGKVNLTAIEMN